MIITYLCHALSRFHGSTRCQGHMSLKKSLKFYFPILNVSELGICSSWNFFSSFFFCLFVFALVLLVFSSHLPSPHCGILLLLNPAVTLPMYVTCTCFVHGLPFFLCFSCLSAWWSCPLSAKV